jgi:hypothetical protein
MRANQIEVPAGKVTKKELIELKLLIKRLEIRYLFQIRPARK